MMRYTHGHRAGTEVRSGDLIETVRAEGLTRTVTPGYGGLVLVGVVASEPSANREDGTWELTLAPGWSRWDEHGPTGKRTDRFLTIAIEDEDTVIHGADPLASYASDWCREAEDAAEDAYEQARDALDLIQRERNTLRAWADERFELLGRIRPYGKLDRA